MRKTLDDLIKETIIFQYTLPCTIRNIDKTHHTHDQDHCYKARSSENIVSIIYNGIIDYSYNECEIDLSTLIPLHVRALKTKIKYNEDARIDVKKKYGFYGEVLLYVILQALFDVDTLISRGYFYNPLESSETKGYDTYQLIEANAGQVELWFGEVKFYESYSQALKKVFDNIDKALSNKYLSTNLIAMCDRAPFNRPDSVVVKIIESWKRNPQIVLADEISKYNITFVYPILVAFDINKKNYDDLIKEVIEHINEKYPQQDFTLTIPYKLFFILLPVENVSYIKSEVISWIESEKQLI